MILIKDNHVDGAGASCGCAPRPGAYPALPVEVEVRNLEELRQVLAIEPPVDRAMLDNMTLDQMRQAVAMSAGRVPLEASGNVTLERAAAIAATGVDYISTGSLTHSAPAFDLSMKVALPESGPLDRQASLADLSARVTGLKAALGDQLVILGHHYQRDEVIAFADYQGDSLELARKAARADAQYIVFCGVHFMAETAAILSKPGQHVISPDPGAGCYLADTASLEQCRLLGSCWRRRWATPTPSSHHSPTSIPQLS